MQVKSYFRTMHIPRPEPMLTRMLFLAGCMVLGMLIGVFAAVRCETEVFSSYLSDFCSLYGQENVPVSVSSAIGLYFGYVVLAFLMGFASLGVLLIPLLSGIYGFVAMYAVYGFTCVYGRSGVIMALGAMGLRHLFVIPCFLWIAACGWAASDRLLVLSLGKGKRCSPVVYDGTWWYHVCLCIVILVVGLFVEIYLTPHIFALTLGL